MGKKNQGKGLWQRIGWGGGMAVLSVFAVAGWIAVSMQNINYDAQERMLSLDQGEWGAEVFDSIHESVIADGLVRPANACGLGASSCFKCHNGTRAPEPDTNPVSAPWHSEHARVNNSCVGCHNGNPRLMREQMAHKDLIADPRQQPGESCASCHKNESELTGFLDAYLKVGQ
jgi:hypothetical protein